MPATKVRVVCKKCGAVMMDNYGDLECPNCGNTVYQCRRNKAFLCMEIPGGGTCSRPGKPCTFAINKIACQNQYQKKYL